MGLFSFFQGGAKYFDKKIDPKCDYCTYGKRTKDGNRVLCEKRGLVEQNFSCKAFIYSPLKRIPVKQLRFVGSIADDDIFIESKGDLAEKAEAENKNSGDNKNNSEKPKSPAPAAKPNEAAQPQAPAKDANNAPAPKAPQNGAPAQKADKAPAQNAAPEKKEEKAPAKQEAPKPQNAKQEVPQNNAPKQGNAK